MTESSSLDDVRAQYEALPYPPRDPRDEAIRLITGTPSHILEINHYLFAGRLSFNRPFRALVAGGGTGDACIMLAQQLADRRCPGEVVYLDLSTASRAICEARAKARGLRNIQFLTGSLLDLPNMNIGLFDYIDCTGVLHHLPDPAAGMKALAPMSFDSASTPASIACVVVAMVRSALLTAPSPPISTVGRGRRGSVQRPSLCRRGRARHWRPR